jgi:hypothetical protein
MKTPTTEQIHAAELLFTAMAWEQTVRPAETIAAELEIKITS